MRQYDVFTEWDVCVKSVNDFLDSHRIEPYTPEEIKELSALPPKAFRIATISLKEVKDAASID